MRKQWEADALVRLQEAEQFLQRLHREDTAAENGLFTEWRSVTERVLWFVFGEVSPHYRLFVQAAALLGTNERTLCFNQLLAALQRARCLLKEQGIDNPLLHIEGIASLPDFEQNKAYDQKAQHQQVLWKMFWLSTWFGPFPF